jgi:hypothetical protein
MTEKETVYLAEQNVPNTMANDLPANDQERQLLVQRLFFAFYNVHNILDEATTLPYRSIIVSAKYKEGEVHLMLWKLLVG